MLASVATTKKTQKPTPPPTKRTPSELGRRVRALRKAKPGLTQDGLAELAGLSRMTVAYLETGQNQTADTDTLVKLARALGARLEELTGTDDDPKIQEAVDVFLASSWGDVTKPTPGEVVRLRAHAGSQWPGQKPKPEALHYLVKAWRAAD